MTLSILERIHIIRLKSREHYAPATKEDQGDFVSGAQIRPKPEPMKYAPEYASQRDPTMKTPEGRQMLDYQYEEPAPTAKSANIGVFFKS